MKPGKDPTYQFPAPHEVRDISLARLLVLELTGDWQATHKSSKGPRPERIGHWYFRIGAGSRNVHESELYKVGDEPLRYEDAVRFAKDAAVTLKCNVIYLDPSSSGKNGLTRPPTKGGDHDQ